LVQGPPRVETPTCREWDFDESSTDSSSDEDAANIAVTKGLLFPNVGHKSPWQRMAKRRR
jgi:hypothetical protein